MYKQKKNILNESQGSTIKMNSFGTNQTFVNMGWHKYLVYPLSKKALYHSGSAELSKLIVHEYQHDS